ncbi:hypothetical protein [Actinoplanes sp. NPDC026619]|uniref:hypothetical protein n=1 Tax=Actinoplanes sp. NPDC026619 TaxID=3155798 RepID=UPI0033E8E00D
MLKVGQQRAHRIGAAGRQQRGSLLITELGTDHTDQRIGDTRHMPAAQGPINPPPIHRRPIDMITRQNPDTHRRSERGTPDRRLRITRRGDDPLGVPGHHRGD